MPDNEYTGDPDVEKLAKVDPRELGEPIDINDQWEQVEIGDEVDIDPAEGGGQGKITDLNDDEATVEKEDGSSVTVDINSVIRISSNPSEPVSDEPAPGLDDDDDLNYEPLSKFDDVLNQKFNDLIDTD